MIFISPGPGDPATSYQRYVDMCEDEYDRENESVRCAMCDRPIGMHRRYLIDSDVYCRKCAEDITTREDVLKSFVRSGAYKCDRCGRKLVGEHYHLGNDFDVCPCCMDRDTELYSDLQDEYLEEREENYGTN